jgi:hypothetical protein
MNTHLLCHLQKGSEFITSCSLDTNGEKAYKVSISSGGSCVCLFFESKEQMQDMALALMIELQKSEAEGMKNAKL